ncbi:MAG: (d)CMP kinase [Syntrophales bacterium]|nr:(d)CMP kinase [Syntrophales bacterium]
MSDKMLITIDGPAGSGKSTVAKVLAAKLSYTYLDTGALYRAVAFKIATTQTDWRNEEILCSLLKETVISVDNEGGGFRVFVDGEDVSNLIRSEAIGILASRISAHPLVREALLGLQRSIGRRGGVVAEGRDMGTVVFPWAEVKFYLDASVDERARRRYGELIARGEKVQFQDIIEDIRIRDRQDTQRDIAPLKPHREAIIINTTSLTVEDVVMVMMDAIVKHAAARNTS